MSIYFTIALGPSSGKEDKIDPHVAIRFSRVDRSFITILEALRYGIEWGSELIVPMMEYSESRTAGVILTICLLVMHLIMINLIAGVIIQTVNDVTLHREEDLKLQDTKKGWDQVDSLLNTFRILDKDNSGSLTWEELQHGLIHHKDELEKVGLPVHKAENLYQMLDIDNSGSVQIQEFIVGLQDSLVPKSLSNLIIQSEQRRQMSIFELHNSERSFQLRRVCEASDTCCRIIRKAEHKIRTAGSRMRFMDKILKSLARKEHADAALEKLKVTPNSLSNDALHESLTLDRSDTASKVTQGGDDRHDGREMFRHAWAMTLRNEGRAAIRKHLKEFRDSPGPGR
eukprot:TRINITY_DN85501_c0_g1_i1.p1 TRINITY_DN85501_c0_g1~~TRINITY_DN85501_c0_g1_i1.p1  ORF type:complete len:385 (+),score=37.78 TRINITY_DN85501_c0_g1_i1:131-1156(+)